MNDDILLCATLPLPPGLNKSYKTATRYINGQYRSILAKTNEAAMFEQEAFLRLNGAMRNNAVIDRVRTSTGKDKLGVAVELCYYFRTLWRRDVDGGDKAALDVIFRHMGINDNRVLDLHVRKRVDSEKPRLEATVRIAYV